MTGKSFKALVIVMSLLIGFTLGALAGIIYMQNLSWSDTPVFLESSSGEIFNDVQKIEVIGDGIEEIEADIFKMTIQYPQVQNALNETPVITNEQFIEKVKNDLTERGIDMEKIFLTPIASEVPDIILAQVTIADRELLQQVVEYLIVLGVTDVQSVELDSGNLEQGKQASAIAAMQDAREKANFIAGTEGKKIKGIFSIEYNPTSQIKITPPNMNATKLEPKLVEELLEKSIKIESSIRVNYKF